MLLLLYIGIYKGFLFVYLQYTVDKKDPVPIYFSPLSRKKNETELTGSVLKKKEKKKTQNTQEVKENVF